MLSPGWLHRRFLVSTARSALLLSTTGCTLLHGFAQVQYAFSLFWETTPLIPVSAYFSQQIEDTYWEEERYTRVPVLDPG
ncbi:MAG: hypothetical protein KY476_24705, partial [Planctomycetes bacterium]|nr:hypothetical protein [Planctomycetota bacterium]